MHDHFGIERKRFMDTNSYKTISANKTTVDKQWVVIDVEGQILGRAASQIAFMLRGKHKPTFTPHVDCGDNVIVINADKVRFTGAKWDQKEYITYSGYPGGQKRITANNLVEKKPYAIVENAVKGMLPKNRLGRQVFKKLFVYAGSEHPHQAQKPQPLEK